MNKNDTNWTETNFPERLFVLGAGPGLELLWPHREEMKNWGYWVIQRADIVKPFLEFINPLYSICYWNQAQKINKGYGIQLLKGCGGFGDSSISNFMTCFSQGGGKELFLFGYDGSNEGYWRNQLFSYKGVSVTGDGWGGEYTKRRHDKDLKDFNKNYNNELLLKMFHLGPTNNIHLCQISIEELKEKL
tara:strand:+ start:1209 stop:1775 length:567 start_codon:yes stop_codon:yes gene_type:complete